MTDLLAMHDIADGQLQSSDDRRLGRVADILCRHQDDGSLEAIALALGPEACLRRISSRFARRVHRLTKGRFGRSVEIGEVVKFGPTLRLREKADAYNAVPEICSNAPVVSSVEPVRARIPNATTNETTIIPMPRTLFASGI